MSNSNLFPSWFHIIPKKKEEEMQQQLYLELPEIIEQSQQEDDIKETSVIIEL